MLHLDRRATYDIPTLMVAGDNDRYIPPALMDSSGNRGPALPMVTVPGGHFLLDENPTALSRVSTCAPRRRGTQRWISAFDLPRLRTISAIKHQAEEYTVETDNAPVPSYVYVTYIRASPEQVWRALTDAELTAQYWAHANESDWQPGSSWTHRRIDGSGIADAVGQVLEAEPPTRLVITFDDAPDQAAAREPSKVTFLVEPHEDIVRLTVTHENLPNHDMRNVIAHGWPAVMANLKSLLETGTTLSQAPWEMSPVDASRR